MTPRALYLVLAAFGFVVPNSLVLLESMETGNLLLWANPAATLAGILANRISTIFILDLFLTVGTFFVWSSYEASRRGMPRPWKVWGLTMLFGLAMGFPLFLHSVERAADDR
jgi:hypothetical protein